MAVTQIPWWNSQYAYRKQITITAGSVNVPVGYPVKLTENTATLQAAGKCLASYNDIRIVQWDGSANTDLSRDRVADASLIFSTQDAITATNADSSYWLYYGNLGESTTKQPSSDSEWLEAYAIFGTSPDSYYKAIWIPRDSSSTLSDSDASYDGTVNGSPTLGTDGPMGRYFTYDETVSKFISFGNQTDLNAYDGSFTIEVLSLCSTADVNTVLCKWSYDSDASNNQYLMAYNNYQMQLAVANTTAQKSAVETGASSSTWYWYAGVYSYRSYVRIYRNGTQTGAQTADLNYALRNPSTETRSGKYVGNNDGAMGGKIAIMAFSKGTARTSFPYASCFGNPPSLGVGSEESIHSLFQGGII